jgi:FkbM family methyltransferase
MSVAEFVYTTVLRPDLLRKTANAIIRSILPKQVRSGCAVTVLNPNDPVISGALAFRVYEKSETAFLKRTFFPGMVFLDIGANIGYYTALAGHIAGPTGRVVALEPDPESFTYLMRTIRANEFTNVTPFQGAAWDRVGSAQLHISGHNRGDNRLYANELASDVVTIRTTTVDALLEEIGIASVDVIKMDVQGAEGWALNGMKGILAQSKPITVLTEFWPEGLRQAKTEPREFLSTLESLGLRIHELRADGSLLPVVDAAALIARYPGRKYTNIVADRA